MKIKKYYHAIGILMILSSFLTACNDDDFLKEYSESFYTYANMFEKYSQVNDCLTELYWYHRSFHYDQGSTFPITGHGTDSNDHNQGGPTLGLSNFSNWSTSSNAAQSVYHRLYIMSAKANLVLEGAELVQWPTEADKLQTIAQARFLRGYFYMILGEMFGGVPINEEFLETAKVDFQRASREDTYLFAINEMEAAVADLLAHPEAGRVGKGMAYHALAEAWLALACDQNNNATYLDNSIAMATEVMKYHSLMKERFGSRANPASTKKINGVDAWFPDGDVFFDLFQGGNFDYEEGNTESLWVLQNDYRPYPTDNIRVGLTFARFFGPVFRNITWNSKYAEGTANGPWAATSLDQFGITLGYSAHIGGMGVGAIAPTKHVQKTIWENCGSDIRNSPVNIRRGFRVLDPRHSLYGFVIDENNVEEYISPNHFRTFKPVYTKFNPIDDYGFEGVSEGRNDRQYLFSDMYYARLSETYLLRAEARLRKNDKAGAADDINEVRGRAKAPLVLADDVTIDYILDERLRELYGEERRWSTLLRMGGNIPNDRITKYGFYIADEPVWSGTLGPDFLFPIPQLVIDSNIDAEIEQNPYWK